MLNMCTGWMQGNLEFTKEGEESGIANQTTLDAVSQLLEVDEKEAEKAVCSRVVAAKGEVMEKGHTLEQAQYGRDAFAKVFILRDVFIVRVHHSYNKVKFYIFVF